MLTWLWSKIIFTLSRRCGWRARGQIVCGTWWWCTPAGDKTQRKTSCWESTSRAKTGKSKPLLCVSVWRSSFFQIGSKLTELLSWIDIDYRVLIAAQIAFSWLYIESTAVGRQENGWEKGEDDMQWRVTGQIWTLASALIKRAATSRSNE